MSCQDNMEIANKCFFLLESTIIKNNELIDLYNKELAQNCGVTQKIERTYKENQGGIKDIAIRLTDKKKLKKSSI